MVIESGPVQYWPPITGVSLQVLLESLRMGGRDFVFAVRTAVVNCWICREIATPVKESLQVSH